MSLNYIATFVSSLADETKVKKEIKKALAFWEI
jgi:hypothetical protein